MTDVSTSATWREIHAQPAIWRAWGAVLDVGQLRDWLAAQDVAEVWFCGAGTSAYIGEIIAAGLEGQPGPRLRAVASTDIVARPQAYLRGPRRLIVSFGRSGNSAESIGTLQALDVLAPDWPRLHITCNAESALAKDARARVILLPEATHDAGFAMTSSFSTMLLTALAIFDTSCAADAVLGRLETLSAELTRLLPGFHAASIAAPPPARAVFVGSGPLAFAAREAALKVMELSAGRIPALWDSCLGFRHGPKSFVLPGTSIWVFPASDPHTGAYDADLTAELRAQFPQLIITSVPVPQPFGDLWSVPLSVALAQVMAVVWSGAMGLPVDDPFAGQGTLSRVVSGVRLHAVVPR
jgi:tagatose-6-phosphate ketose/aldose isomerase